MNEELILSRLKEIRDDQKFIVEKISRMDREMEITRNGFTPHQIVEMLHFVAKLKEKEEKYNETIRKAIISWITPILLGSIILGLIQMYK
jgi:hypothetical protein